MQNWENGFPACVVELYEEHLDEKIIKANYIFALEMWPQSFFSCHE